MDTFFIVTECNSTRQFQCLRTLVCVDKSLQCNGVENCQDGSDEENCRMLPKQPNRNLA